MDAAALKLMDQLIGSWSDWNTHREYYINVLAPQIVASDSWDWLPKHEQILVRRLHDRLSRGAWSALPTSMAEREQWLCDARVRAEQEAVARAEAERRAELARQEAERLAAAEREREERERVAQEEARRLRRRALRQRLEQAFETDFLGADQFWSRDPDSHLIDEAEYADLRAQFVIRWARRELNETLDAEQAAAVAATSGNVAVTARAGSGKTRTLVTRAIFLQKHCRVSPRRLLLLAFNRDAAEEMRKRLVRALGNDLPFVLTFHALAYRLVHPEEDLLFDDPASDEYAMSKELQLVIDRHLASDEFRPLIRDLMLAHFREDWERIVAGRIHLSVDEFLAYRRALPRETLRGEYVKSFGERVIANALFEHAVDYGYERNYRWDGTNYRPDFTIATGDRSGVVIEYFGLEGDADYDAMSEEKRAFWAMQDGWTLLEYTPRDLTQAGEQAFVQRMLEDLSGADVDNRRRSEEEIWELTRERAVDSFSRAMATFVRRARKQNLSPDDLESLVAGHVSSSSAEELFLTVGRSVYRQYLAHLAANGKEDFDGLMWRAVAEVRRGQTRWDRNRTNEHGDLAQIRFVMIDEFQDFSEQFFSLIEAVRTQAAIQLFCVGDDWQAINGFAGGTHAFLTGFEKHFADPHRRTISANYRSATSVVEVGNALMQGLGVPARAVKTEAGGVWLGSLDGFRPTPVEQAEHSGDEITPAVLRLVRRSLERQLDVVLLARRHGVPWYVNYPARVNGPVQDHLERFCEHVRSFLPPDDRGRVTASTTHSYKGREQQAVIVIDAVARSYPLLHPQWVFLRVFGDSLASIESEERRLFYVAISRAIDSLVLLTEQHRRSPYLADLERGRPLRPVPWDRLPPAPSVGGARLEIRIGNAAPFATLAIKDALREQGYHWNRAHNYWAKAVLADGFSFDELCSQPWAATPSLTIEVFSEHGARLKSRDGSEPATRR